MNSFNLQKQIDYWHKLSITDIGTAEILIDKLRILHGLFFCHLSIEKILKAHYVRCNKKLAPKTHNLLYLADNTDLRLSDSQMEFLGLLLKYQLEGRYPENETESPGKEKAEAYLTTTKELLNWLILKL